MATCNQEALPEERWQELRQYMDLDKVGRLRRKQERGVFVCNGYAVPNPKAEFQEVYDGKHLPEVPAWLTTSAPALRVQLKRCGRGCGSAAKPGGPQLGVAILSLYRTAYK